MAKIIFKLSILFFLFGCAIKQKVKHPISIAPVAIETAETPIETEEPETPIIGAPPSVKIIPKIGLIFSGGGAKAWAHVGFIKEIEKVKWPIHSVAGFEWGSVIAGIFAQNFSSNEVEWELSKVKDFENLTEISDMIFGKKSVSDLKIPFVCSSLNISKQTIYLLNRGQLNKLIPFCLAQPPLSKPYLQSVAEMQDITALAQHLRATGANKIVLINVLSQNKKHSFLENYLSAENILWANSAALMAKRVAGINDTININLDDYGIGDINKKREIIAKGAELSYDEIVKLTKKYGL